MRPLVVHSHRSAVAAALMSAAVAGCVANVHGTGSHRRVAHHAPDGGTDVRFDVTPGDLTSPIDFWSVCYGATGLNCPVAPCGNGRLDLPAETCDDGNTKGGDGCSPDCKTETDWICTAPGKPAARRSPAGTVWSADRRCATTATRSRETAARTVARSSPAGSARRWARAASRSAATAMVMGGETCDDGNDMAGDGCSDACRVEPGSACPTPGSPATRRSAATAFARGTNRATTATSSGVTVAAPTAGPSPSAWAPPAAPRRAATA